MVQLPADVAREVERMGELSFVTRLAPRHREVAAFVARGHTNQEIARALGLSVHTVNGYVREALLVTGARNRAQLVRVIQDRTD